MMKNKKLFYVILGVFALGIAGVGLLVYVSKPGIEDVKAQYETAQVDSNVTHKLPIEYAKAKHKSYLLNIPGVIGVGIGKCNGTPCIKVYLEKETPESKNIPKQLEGFKVDVEVISPVEVSGQLKIQTDRDTYRPPMCSAWGIGLTPIYTSNRHPETLKFRWNTNYGYFSIWDHELGHFRTEVINNGEKIYWSYDLDDMGKEKPLVRISLRIEDAQSGRILAETNLEIEWEDIDIAKVKY